METQKAVVVVIQIILTDRKRTIFLKKIGKMYIHFKKKFIKKI